MTIELKARAERLATDLRFAHYSMGEAIEVIWELADALSDPADVDARLNKAYSERAYAAAGMARMALALGYKAGIGQDNNEESDPEWRVVLYVDTPKGQVSWHIAPHDQWVLDGLPQYDKPWDGTIRSRDGSYAEWGNVKTPLEGQIAEYIATRDAYEDGTRPRGAFGASIYLKHNDPRAVRYREARATLEALK
ncbi:hypothetical protein WKW50_16335 [Ochrobactrum sp. GPK 3]